MIPVTTSVFNPDALAKWANESYQLSLPARCQVASIGVNHVYQIQAGEDLYFLRVSPIGWRSRAELEGELAFIEALHAAGVSVSRAQGRADGDAISSLDAPEGARSAILFAAAPGADVYDITVTQSREYGRVAARLHSVADAIWPQPIRMRFGLDQLLHEPYAAIQGRFPEAREELRRLEPIVETVVRRLESVPRDAPLYGLCHGDLHPANARFGESGELTLFDFDFSGFGWRMYDLTVFLWNSFGERRPKRWRDQHWRAFIGGYKEYGRLEPELLELVPLFLVARHIWLMGMDCGGHGGWPPQWITVRLLRDVIKQIDLWRDEFAILR